MAQPCVVQGERWLVHGAGEGSLQGWKQPFSTDGFFDGFCYCEDPERERVPHPRLDVLLFSKMRSFNSSEYSCTFILMSSSVGSSEASLLKPSFSPLLPSLCLLTIPLAWQLRAAGDAIQVLFTLTTQRQNRPRLFPFSDNDDAKQHAGETRGGERILSARLVWCLIHEAEPQALDHDVRVSRNGECWQQHSGYMTTRINLKYGRV